MKSLFKKAPVNDSSQKLPAIPKAQKEESNADHSITSFFRDLSRKKTAPQSGQSRQQEHIISRK